MTLKIMNKRDTAMDIADNVEEIQTDSQDFQFDDFYLLKYFLRMDNQNPYFIEEVK